MCAVIFAIFKSADSFLLGRHTQEFSCDVIGGSAYRGTDGYPFKGDGCNPDYDQFAPKLNKPKAAYHTINRRDFYKTTLEEIRLREAFIDFFGLNNALADSSVGIHFQL